MTQNYSYSIFSLKGKMSRTAYIVLNLILNIIGFRFLYYPAIMNAIHLSPNYNDLIRVLSQSPQNAWLVSELKAVPEDLIFFLVVKYLFMIPFRIIDIKRLKDILDRELKKSELLFVAVIFSLPYVDFITTLFLSILKPGKFAKNSEIAQEVKVTDLKEARIENFQLQAKKQFEMGKISRAEYLEATKKSKD